MAEVPLYTFGNYIGGNQADVATQRKKRKKEADVATL